jgi:hypothetical protein
MLHGLEHAEARAPMPTKLDGIVVLGGSEYPEITAAYGVAHMSDDSERLSTFVGLARQHPQAKLVFTGGSGVTLLALGGIVLPMLLSEHYDEDFSLGLVTASGSLGLLFPPSLPLILYAVVAGASTLSTVTNSKPLMALIGPNGVDGSMLSTAGQTKEADVVIPTVPTAAGDTFYGLIVPSTVAAASKLTNLSLAFKDGLGANDTNYAKFHVVNKGTGGVGTQVLVDNTNAATVAPITIQRCDRHQPSSARKRR